MPKKKTSNKAARSSRSKPDPLGQVKDLLFGAEFTAQEQRTRTAELRLQKKLERQSAALAERVARLSTRVTKTKQTVDESLDELRREGVRLQREIKQQVTDAVQQLKRETTRTLAAIETRVGKTLHDVQHKAADRLALAALFEDFAHRIGGARPKNKK